MAHEPEELHAGVSFLSGTLYEVCGFQPLKKKLAKIDFEAE